MPPELREEVHKEWVRWVMKETSWPLEDYKLNEAGEIIADWWLQKVEEAYKLGLRHGKLETGAKDFSDRFTGIYEDLAKE